MIIASWCGKAVKKKRITDRAGWERLSAVRNRHLYEIKSTYILQPGPAALTEGVRQLHAVLAHVVGAAPKMDLAPAERLDPDLADGSGGHTSS